MATTTIIYPKTTSKDIKDYIKTSDEKLKALVKDDLDSYKTNNKKVNEIESLQGEICGTSFMILLIGVILVIVFAIAKNTIPLYISIGISVLSVIVLIAGGIVTTVKANAYRRIATEAHNALKEKVTSHYPNSTDSIYMWDYDIEYVDTTVFFDNKNESLLFASTIETLERLKQSTEEIRFVGFTNERQQIVLTEYCKGYEFQDHKLWFTNNSYDKLAADKLLQKDDNGNITLDFSYIDEFFAPYLKK